MTYPQDPYGHNPFSYDPLGRVPFESGVPFEAPPVQPPVFNAQPAPSHRPPVNPLATLSMVFAFVFAPAGAILGHLGLRQIRRTGELGRDRALIGVTLSYAFIALTVVALVAWATFAATRAATRSNQTAAPATTTTASAPQLPTVAPQAAPTLLPAVDDLKKITGDENLEAGQAWDHPNRSNDEGTIDRPECWGSIGPGSPDAYNLGAMSGYHAQEFTDTHTLLSSVEVIQAVAVFHDAPAAQSQLAKVLTGWRQCGGATVNVTLPTGQTIPFDLSAPDDAGNGVTAMDVTHKGIRVRSVRAIAAKANVFIDLYLSFSGKTDSERPRQAAVGIANYILGKIPS